MPNKKKDEKATDNPKPFIEQLLDQLHEKAVEVERGYLPPIHHNQPFLIVHAVVEPGTLHRIWANTIQLECLQTSAKYELKGMLNVSQYPEKTAYLEPSVYTLLFDRPNRECTSFNLVEDIPESNGLITLDIERNDLDVYFVQT